MFFNLSSTKTIQNTSFYLWIAANSPSRDMSSTPRKITRHKWTIYVNDTRKVELAIGSISSQLNTSEETLTTKIEYYRYFRIAYDTSWVVLSQIHIQDFWNRLQCVQYQNPRHFKENYLIAVSLSDPLQTFGNPLRAVFTKIGETILSIRRDL